ncbi:MAG: hypothetical protein CM15mP71_4650 [Candidatus Poseidoniales archaeon]|nr:MAG: hypothetical protein CM15mP71_4650 [Candidatus Poseidoniales archaeon]
MEVFQTPRYMALESSRGLYFYLEVLKTALDDEIVTNDEASILKVLAVALGVSPSAVGDAMDVARGIDPSPIDDTRGLPLTSDWRCDNLPNCIGCSS